MRIPSGRGYPRTLEVFLEAHRDHVAFIGNSDLYCPTIFILRCLVDRFVAGVLLRLCYLIDALKRIAVWVRGLASR